jgi:hypothetical protein
MFFYRTMSSPDRSGRELGLKMCIEEEMGG